MENRPGKRKRKVVVPDPERVRSLDGTGFGWIDGRILREGWITVLTPEAVSVYALLCLAADRSGVSFYSRGRMAGVLGLGDHEIYKALHRLRELDLVAYLPFFDGAVDGFHQVLPVPPGGPPRPLAQFAEQLAERLRPRRDPAVREADADADRVLRGGRDA